jgi:hypothetical protein
MYFILYRLRVVLLASDLILIYLKFKSVPMLYYDFPPELCIDFAFSVTSSSNIRIETQDNFNCIDVNFFLVA